MPVNIQITGENATQAIVEFAILAAAFTSQNAAPIEVKPIEEKAVVVEDQKQSVPVQHHVPVSPLPVQGVPVYSQQVQQQPTNLQGVPVQSPAPGQFNVPPATAVPTSVQTYEMDQLAVAATQLVDANRREELVQLLAAFGVQALTQLPKQQYGAFATKLREMGAKI